MTKIKILIQDNIPDNLILKIMDLLDQYRIPISQEDLSVIKPQIGIMTAIPKEYISFKKLMKNVVDIFCVNRGSGRGYSIGEIQLNDSNSVSVILMVSGMGNNLSSIRTTRCLMSFPLIKFFIMTGIAGGVPYPNNPKKHVRLGDIVISDAPGIIQYDFIKETADGVIMRSIPQSPSKELLEIVRSILDNMKKKAKHWMNDILFLQNELKNTRPPINTDILLSSSEPDKKIEHPIDIERVNNQPRIFKGLIASANNLLKNPLKRDNLRDNYNIMAIEMEGSGISDATNEFKIGYLVVRGISDYCDKNKNDLWQIYASIVSSSFTKTIIENLPIEILK